MRVEGEGEEKERRDAPSLVLRIGLEVQVANVSRAIERIGFGSFKRRGGSEWPAEVTHVGRDDSDV